MISSGFQSFYVEFLNLLKGCKLLTQFSRNFTQYSKNIVAFSRHISWRFVQYWAVRDMDIGLHFDCINIAPSLYRHISQEYRFDQISILILLCCCCDSCLTSRLTFFQSC